MSDENHIGNAAVREGVAYGVGLLLSGIVAWLTLARKRISAWWKKPSKHDIALNLASDASVLASKVAQEVADAVRQMSDATNRVATSLENGMREMSESLHNLALVQSIHQAATEIVMGESMTARWTCDSAGKCVFANRKCQELFGLSEQEMMDYGWMVRVPWDHRARVKADFERIYREEKGSSYNYAAQYPVEQKDGTIVNILSAAERVVYDPTGKRVLAVYGTCEPVPMIRRVA
jgi:PAS domain S-box-containing protein